MQSVSYRLRHLDKSWARKGLGVCLSRNGSQGPAHAGGGAGESRCGVLCVWQVEHGAAHASGVAGKHRRHVLSEGARAHRWRPRWRSLRTSLVGVLAKRGVRVAVAVRGRFWRIGWAAWPVSRHPKGNSAQFSRTERDGGAYWDQAVRCRFLEPNGTAVRIGTRRCGASPACFFPASKKTRGV